METPVNAYRESFRVRAYEAGLDGHATLATLCNYFQEAAGNHAHALRVATDQLADENLAWVLSRLRIDVVRYPAWRESIDLVTWPSDVDRLYAYRDFACFDASNRRIAAGVSAWLLIHLDTRRPVRMPERITRLRLPERPRALGGAFDEVDSVDEAEMTRAFLARLDDLDMMRHVNNTRYVGWIGESVPERVRDECEVASLTIDFRSETLLGERVRVDTASGPSGDGLLFQHELKKGDGARMVARARTAWRGRTDSPG